MEAEDNWTAIAIRKSRLNAIKAMGLKRDRSAGNILDMILEKANVGEMSDEELARKEKEISA